jgi:predicted protein tyrosine phosphatase
MGGSCVKPQHDGGGGGKGGNDSPGKNKKKPGQQRASTVAGTSGRREYRFLQKLPPKTAAFKEMKPMPLPTKDQIMKRLLNPDFAGGWRTLREPEFAAVTQITPHLFLTSYSGMNQEDLSRNKVTWVINTTTEMPMFDKFKETSLRVPVEDDRSEDIYPYLDHCADAIAELIKHKESVVVHCMAGVSRSAVIVLAYLIKYEKRSLRNAYNFVANKRPVIRPNSTFFAALVKFENEHLKDLDPKSRTKMIYVKKNGKVMEVPNWLWYDQVNKFDEEFSANRMMNTVTTRDESRKFIDLDQDPAYMADHMSEILGPGASTPYKSTTSSHKTA